MARDTTNKVGAEWTRLTDNNTFCCYSPCCRSVSSPAHSPAEYRSSYSPGPGPSERRGGKLVRRASLRSWGRGLRCRASSCLEPGRSRRGGQWGWGSESSGGQTCGGGFGTSEPSLVDAGGDEVGLFNCESAECVGQEEGISINGTSWFSSETGAHLAH